MSRLRLVSIAHPAGVEPMASNRFDYLHDVDATVLVPSGATHLAAGGTAKRLSIAVRGRGRGLRYPSLATALALLNPDVVHLQADPDTKIARQVARLCGAKQHRSFVLETDTDITGSAGWKMMASLRARYVLANAGALVARSPAALSCMRRLGFRGVGVVAGRGQQPIALPLQDEARRLLAIGGGSALVIGWMGPTDLRSGVIDVLEAIAVRDSNVTVVIPASGKARHDLTDRADALEVLDRVRFVEPGLINDPRSWPVIGSCPMLAAAVDALILPPPRHRQEREVAALNLEFAQAHGIPSIHQGQPIATNIGPGGWVLPAADPPLLARLLATLTVKPALLQDASAAALDHASRRHSPQAAASDLAHALRAALSVRAAGQAGAEPRRPRIDLRLFLKREPSRT